MTASERAASMRDGVLRSIGRYVPNHAMRKLEVLDFEERYALCRRWLKMYRSMHHD
jgi:hypothetical protein